MRKEIVLPSLFVLNAFLVGMIPKTGKAGSCASVFKPELNGVSYTVPVSPEYWAPQKFGPEYVDFMKMYYQNPDSNHNKLTNPTNLYNISSYDRCVKYVSEDGSGFIRSGGSRTWRNMNPGALRHGSFSKQYGACGSAGGFAVFPTEEQGMDALRGLLKSDKYADLTIYAAIYKYAPPSDHNNTKSYQLKLSKMTGLSLNLKLKQLTPDELERVVNAIKTIEGWKVGSEQTFTADGKISYIEPELMQFLNHTGVKQYQYGA